MDEIQGRECEIVFLNHAPSDDPEGQLLVQIQGVIAEYERAKICDRMRRGKLHHARHGAVVSWKAPYGYRYVPRQVDERGRWEIDETETSCAPYSTGSRTRESRSENPRSVSTYGVRQRLPGARPGH